MNMRHIAIAAGVAALAAGTLPASDLPRDAADVVSLELLPGYAADDGTRMAGLKLRLAPGWKTYWRAPGAAGVPPAFDWSGSDNLRAVRVHWPRPGIHVDNGVTTIGYAEEVVLPVELFPAEPGAATEVAGRLAFGVCREICLPVTLPYRATLAPGMAEAGSAEIRDALARRPASGAARGDTARCDLEPIADGLRVTAEIEAAAQGGTEIVVIEPGRDDLWVSEAAVERRGGRVTATAEIVPPEAAPFALARDAIRITLLGRDGAVEWIGCRGAG